MNSTVFKCEYCQSTFKTKGNLTYHKKNAKFCLIKRGETNISNVCEYCSKNFSSKQRLLSHIEICYKNKEETISNNCIPPNDRNSIELLQSSELSSETRDLILKLKTENHHLKKQNESFREQIDKLQEKLASIALEGIRKTNKTTKITNNTTTTNNTNVTQILTPFDLDHNDIQRIVEQKMDENTFLNSQSEPLRGSGAEPLGGIAKFCVDNILKTEDGKMRMICTDPSRERFKYMDENGIVKEDIQARQFIEKIYPPIHQAGEKIHEGIIENCQCQLLKIAKGELAPEGGSSEARDDTDRYIPKTKEEASHNCWLEVRCIKSNTSNGTFRKELAILSNV